MSQDELKKKIIDFTGSYEYSNLITIDNAGLPKGRMMENIAMGDDMAVYYATGAQSDKVVEVRNNPAASAFFYRPSDHSFVSVQGRAEIVTDEAVKKEKWKDKWTKFWKDGPSDPAYTLIRIVPNRITFLDFPAHSKEVLDL